MRGSASPLNILLVSDPFDIEKMHLSLRLAECQRQVSGREAAQACHGSLFPCLQNNGL